jgi:hypothetical protein
MQVPPLNRFAETGDQAEDAALPCAAALVGGTLALMTAWVDVGDGVGSSAVGDGHRRLLARKIVSNLFFLRHHPALQESLRRVVGNVHERWLPIANAAEPDADAHADALLALPVSPVRH